MKKKYINTFFKRLSKNIPNPKSDLKYKNNFTLLIAVLLSAQSTDTGVNKATKKLFLLANNPQSILNLGLTKLKSLIKTIGLYNSKAKNIINLSKILIEKYNGKIPKTREDLVSLPGVGRKTANVVLNIAFKKATIAVDTHIFRVSNRTKIALGKNPLDVELSLEKIVPEQYKMNAHHLLILHGRYICKSQKPLCKKCSISSICQFKGKLI